MRSAAHPKLAVLSSIHCLVCRAGPIKSPFRSSFVLGNLSREEARTYFFDYLLPFRKHPCGASEAWERVYKVCGGNPGLLLKCTSKATALKSWELGACVRALLCSASAAENGHGCT